MATNNQIPSGWEMVKLGEVCFTTSGGTPSRKVPKYYGGNIPWVKSGELDKGLILNTEEKITEEAINDSSAKIFPKGTLLIALYGATVGKLAFLGIDAASNQAVCGIFNSGFIESNFLYHFLFFRKNKLLSQSIGGAQPNISQGILKDLDFPLPPLPEQHRIVSKIEELFSDLDKGIENLQTAQQQLKVYRQAVLKWAFEGKITNKNVVDGELPKGWKLFKLKDLTVEREGLRRGPFGSAIRKEFFVPDGYKVYEQSNAIKNNCHIGKYFVDEIKYQELINFKIVPNDLIVSCSGSLGRITEVPKDAKQGIINQALLRIRLKKNIISNKLFILQFRSAHFQKKIFDQSQGTAMANLVGIKDFKEIEMTVPPLNEQQKFIEEIESRLSVCDKIEEIIETSLLQSQALRLSIIKKGFEGKLVKQNPADEPAQKLLERIRALRQAQGRQGKWKPEKKAKKGKKKVQLL